VQLVEQHCINKQDLRYRVIDEAAFQSENLYNAALYEMRQAFIWQGVYLSYEVMDTRMQSHEAYQVLPAKVSQQVLRQLAEAWKAFREAKAAYEEDPSKFTGPPQLPKYKHKSEGRNILIYTMQAVSRNKKYLAQGIIKPSQLAITIQTITNLAAITSNRMGWVPRLVNGRPIKAWNQWYNKRMKELKLCLPKEERERVTKQMEQITNTRNRQINHYLHAASKRIIDFLAEEGVGTIIIGKNPLWKQDAGMGKRNNQNFVSIPHARFIDMLTYKASLVGIGVEVREESYTSKASFLDLDSIPMYKRSSESEHVFSGKRIGRRSRLYRAKDGHIICADVNGSYNILRKSRPNAFSKAKGVAGYVVHPLRLVIAV